MKSVEKPENLIEIAPGTSGKAHLLHEALLGVICSSSFGEMTLAEVLGALELVKYALVLRAR